VERFGSPISPFEFRNNQTVQYFENARFEWHPEQAEDQRVRLTNLGRIYFDQLGEDPGFLGSVPNNLGPVRVLNLQVHAFPANAVTTSDDQQKIFVLVQDQNLQPVAAAQGVETIRLPSGGELTEDFSVRDGVCELDFAFINQPKGQLVQVDFTVTYASLATKTTTSFRIWY